MRTRREPRRRGTSAVEMAVIAPVFLTLVLGIIESSRLGMVCQLLTTAAREGCRVAVISRVEVINGMTETDVQKRINTALNGSGISGYTVTTTPSTWSSAPGGTPITVSLSVPYANVSWLPTPFFFKGAVISVSATMSSENP